MTVQDDRREAELIQLFELSKDGRAGRTGTDAMLRIEASEYAFELKSTSRGGVTTVRDFGPSHVTKWAGKHWLIGVYDHSGNQLLYTLYGAPQHMAPWIAEKSAYIALDMRLASVASGHLTLEDLDLLFGGLKSYSLEHAQRLHKRQWTRRQYLEAMDITQGYSPKRFLEILQDRCRYLIQRGSTLNNPHIPASYFSGWPRITRDHAETLRRMVLGSLSMVE